MDVKLFCNGCAKSISSKHSVFTGDLHICGGCKVQYNALAKFLEHKPACSASLQLCSDRTELKPSLESLDVTELVKLENLNNVNKESLPLTIELLEGNDLIISPVLVNNNNQNETDGKLEYLNDKTPLHNDEQAIAAFLANQLSDQPPMDGILDEACEEKEEEVKEEKLVDTDSKMLYRGKMRKLLVCNAVGCTYKTLLRKDYERHERVHTGERPFKCVLCEKTFTRADKLLLHERIHSGDKRYKCTECDYASVDSGSLLKHLRIHNGERPFKCQLCPYRARDSSQLTVHLRTHTGDCPFTCTNNKCKAAFKTNSDLKRHMTVHSGQKPHACQFCTYKCTLKRNLQIHMQSQHPNGELKEYLCPQCPRLALPTIRRLRNHVKKYHEDLPPQHMETTDRPRFEKRRRKSKQQTDEVAVGVMNKPHECTSCDASFVTRDSLLIHERYHSRQNRRLKHEESEHHHVIDGTVYTEALELPLHTVTDNLRSAEILASLNVVSPREYAMMNTAHHEIQYTTC